MSQLKPPKTDSSDTPAMRIVTRADRQFEQVVMAELLVPNVPNVYGDIYTVEAIKEFAYEFAKQGYGLDVDHDNEDIDGTKAIVVESFLVRAGDPDFIEGSWVVGMKILDADLWASILAGEINGYSFEAEAYMLPVILQNLANRQVVGTTEPDPLDGHTHTYLVILNVLNRPISGGTGNTLGHSHKIVTHTKTEVAGGLLGTKHSHRYQVIVTADKENGDVGTI